MTTLTYYAKDAKYELKDKIVNEYHIDTFQEKTSTIGDIQSLIALASLFKKFYSKNSQDIALNNCTDRLKEKGFRPLFKLEEEVLLSTIKNLKETSQDNNHNHNKCF